MGGKTVGRGRSVADGREAGDGGQVDVGSQGVKAGRAHRLDAGGGAENSVSDGIDGQAGGRTGQIDRAGRAGLENAAVAAVIGLEDQPGGGAGGGDSGVDEDTVIAVQGQGVVGRPTEGGIDVDIAVGARTGAIGGGGAGYRVAARCGLDGDIAAGQAGLDGAVVGTVDDEIGGIQQPAAGMAQGRADIHPGRIEHLQTFARGLDQATVAALGTAAGQQHAVHAGHRAGDLDMAAVADGIAGRGVDHR